MKTRNVFLSLLLLFVVALSGHADNFGVRDINSQGVALMDEFNTPSEVNPVSSTSLPDHAVDLGLSVMWADVNIGADSPEGKGYRFAWGETSSRANNYLSDTYAYQGKDIGEDISGTEYDAAHVVWGDLWRMPTLTEYKELEDKCTWKWTKKNGHYGYNVTGVNGNSIFLPCCGYRQGKKTYFDDHGYYWTSTYSNASDDFATILGFSSSHHRSGDNQNRWRGLHIRAVYPKQETGVVTTKTIPQEMEGVYDLQGHKLHALQKGINLVRYNDGTVKKVLKK